MEIASESTWKRDRDEKPARYASLGVGEYFLYDPMGSRLDPRLQGYALHGGRYRRLREERLGNGERGVCSPVLGLCAWLRGPSQELRWYDPVTGRDLEDYDEAKAGRDAAEERTAAAEDRARRRRIALGRRRRRSPRCGRRSGGCRAGRERRHQLRKHEPPRFSAELRPGSRAEATGVLRSAREGLAKGAALAEGLVEEDPGRDGHVEACSARRHRDRDQMVAVLAGKTPETALLGLRGRGQGGPRGRRSKPVARHPDPPPATDDPACPARSRSARARFGTSTTGTRSAPPDAVRRTAAVRPADRRRGTTTAAAPAPAALRTQAPRLRGSCTWSRTRMSGGGVSPAPALAHRPLDGAEDGRPVRRRTAPDLRTRATTPWCFEHRGRGGRGSPVRSAAARVPPPRSVPQAATVRVPRAATHTSRIAEGSSSSTASTGWTP